MVSDGDVLEMILVKETTKNVDGYKKLLPTKNGDLPRVQILRFVVEHSKVEV